MTQNVHSTSGAVQLKSYQLTIVGQPGKALHDSSGRAVAAALTGIHTVRGVLPLKERTNPLNLSFTCLLATASSPHRQIQFILQS